MLKASEYSCQIFEMKIICRLGLQLKCCVARMSIWAFEWSGKCNNFHSKMWLELVAEWSYIHFLIAHPFPLLVTVALISMTITLLGIHLLVKILKTTQLLGIDCVVQYLVTSELYHRISWCESHIIVVTSFSHGFLSHKWTKSWQHTVLDAFYCNTSIWIL